MRLLAGLRARVAGTPWMRRLVRTATRYRDRDGNHHAAALTFFTLLALVPLVMLAVSVAGFVLAADAVVLAQFDALIAVALPAGASGAVSSVVRTVVAERSSLGVVALAVALFSGWSWISHVRDSVTAMLDQPRPRGRLLLTVGSLALGLLANWVVVGWCLAKLPRDRRPVREVLVAAAVGAVGLAALQQLGGLFLTLLGRSPAVTTLGAIVGLLLFVYVLMRWLLIVTVWSAAFELRSRACVSVPQDGNARTRPEAERRASSRS